MAPATAPEKVTLPAAAPWERVVVTLGTAEETTGAVGLTPPVMVVTVEVLMMEVLVQGQSVMVTVPGAVTVIVLLPSTMVVGSGQ